MAAATTDKFKKTGASTVTALAAPGKAVGASSITVGSTTNYPTTTGIIISIRVVDTNGDLVAGTYTEWRATVSSGTTFAIETTPVYGSDQVYAAGSTTQVSLRLSSYAHNELVDGILVHADQDGTLKAGAVDVAAVLASDVVETAKIKDANVTTAKLASGAVTSTTVATGMPVQVVSTNYSAVATGTTVTFQDDTIPQITEGIEFMTQAITPKSATNILVIEVVALLSTTVAGGAFMQGALFQDATANALAAGENYYETANSTRMMSVSHTMAAGTTSSTTFRFRAGTGGAGTTTLNGVNSVRRYGAITKSLIKITEYKA